MKKVYTIMILLLIAAGAQAQTINWMTMEDALEAQKEQPKKILMDAYTDWCGPCKLMDRNTFTHPEVISYINKHYYPVKFNAEGAEVITYKGRTFKNPGYVAEKKGRNSVHELTRALKVTGYPSLVFFAENGDLIGPIPGYRSPSQLELYLKLFAAEDYKEIQSAEDFQQYSQKFRPEFKEVAQK